MGDWAMSLAPQRRMFPAVEFPCAARDGDLTTASRVYSVFPRLQILSVVFLTGRAHRVYYVMPVADRMLRYFFFFSREAGVVE